MRVGGLVAVIMALAAPALRAQPVVTKAHVAELIVKVENGVDDFRKYLEQRGENAKDAAASTPQGNDARAPRPRRKRRGRKPRRTISTMPWAR